MSGDHIEGFLCSVELSKHNNFEITLVGRDTAKTFFVDSTTYKKCYHLYIDSTAMDFLLKMKKIDTTKDGKNIYTLTSYKISLPSNAGSGDYIMYAPAE